MLKEVGASGQISLGKKYAGQLFDLQTLEDGSIVMRPVKVVPVSHPVHWRRLADPRTHGPPRRRSRTQPGRKGSRTHPVGRRQQGGH